MGSYIPDHSAGKMLAVAGPSGLTTDPGDTDDHAIEGLSVVLPRAGTYAFNFTLFGQLSADPTVVGFGVKFSGTTQLLSAVCAYLPQSDPETLPTLELAGTSPFVNNANGVITVAGPGTLSVQFNRDTNTISWLAGGGGWVIEK